MKIFTKFDFINKYYQITINLKNHYKTIFKIYYEYYEFNVISFELMNIFIIFQILMNDIFRNLLNVYIIIYFDDIFIYSKNEKDHE